jgi:hypothetical protein
MRSRFATVLVLAVGCWFSAGTAGAQSGLTVTSPAANARLAAGPDFATDVLGDPWDMSNPEDISIDPQELSGWTNFRFTPAGEVGGTVTGNPSSIAFLRPGRYGSLNTGRSGLRHPIDSATFRRLAVKLKSAANQQLRVYWYHRPWEHPAGIGYGVRFSTPTAAGYQVLQMNLDQALAAGETWTSSAVRGLRIDPNTTAANYEVLFDWIRLTVPDSHPAAVKHQVTWTGGSGTSTIEVVDAGGTAMTVASGLAGTSYTWYYGVLPPGRYTLRITRGSATVSTPFSINAPPVVHVVDPDETGGEDFAAAVLGNPWDMSDAADVKTSPYDHLVVKQIAGGLFHGVSDGVPVAWAGSVPVGDPIVYVLNGNGVVDTDRYRYLTVRLKVDDPYDLGLGSVGRVMWSSRTQAFDVTVSGPFMTWPGWNTYSFDLAALSSGPGGGIEPGGPRTDPWTAADVRHLRLDPHEFAQLRGFDIDWVKLAAIDESRGSFVLRWSGADPDGDPATVTLYYDNNTNPLDGRTFIATLDLATGQRTWNTSAVPPGRYWIYAETTDGLNATGRYSTGMVEVLSGAAASPALTIDAPLAASSVPQGSRVSGWAIDQSAAEGTGIDEIHVYAYPNPGSGLPPVFIGSAPYGASRPDVGAVYGAQFTPSGFELSIGTLAPGAYRLAVFARSTVAGSFNVHRTVDVTVTASKLLAIDPLPAGGVPQPFSISGWAIDRAAPAGTGIDAVHVYAYPNGGGGAVWGAAATLGASRPDVAAAYGTRYEASGFAVPVRGLAPGTYRFVAYARSTVSGAFDVSGQVTHAVTANTQLALDAPVAGATVNQTFTISGWALDLASAGGTGVDAVHAYASPAAGGSSVPLGIAELGQSRPDVGAVFGSQFTASGYRLTASLAAGTYNLTVYARSTVTGTFSKQLTARVTVRQSAPIIFLDRPSAGAIVSSPFVLSGWALDLGAPAGTGVDAIHVWAYPLTGGAAVWVGAATYGTSRPDVGAYYGAQFSNAGFTLAGAALAPGTYDLVLFPHSTLSAAFSTPLVVRVTAR